VAAGDPLFCGRWGPALTARGIQLAIARLGRRAAVGTRCSPHTFRHTFARGYLVNGGDVFSLQQILGHTTLDMVRRYVYVASFEMVRRLHAAASPADGLIGPRVSLFIPRAWVDVLEGLADASRVMVQDVIREAIARRLATVMPPGECRSPNYVSGAAHAKLDSGVLASYQGRCGRMAPRRRRGAPRSGP